MKKRGRNFFLSLICLLITGCVSSQEAPMPSTKSLEDVLPYNTTSASQQQIDNSDLLNGIPRAVLKEIALDPVLVEQSDYVTFHFPQGLEKNYCCLVTVGDTGILIDSANTDNLPIVLNYISECNLSRLIVVVTSVTALHCGSLPEILSAFSEKIERVILPPRLDHETLSERIRTSLCDYKIPVSLMVHSQTYSFSDTLSLTAYYPYSSAPEKASEASMVLMLRVSGRDFLFLGNASEKEQEQVLPKIDSQKLDFAVFSPGAISYSLLNRLKPTYSILPIGINDLSSSYISRISSSQSRGLYLADTGGYVFVLEGDNLSLRAGVFHGNEEYACQTEAQETEDETDVRVYVCGNTYHYNLNCRYVDISNVSEEWLSVAKAKGMKPCQNCGKN